MHRASILILAIFLVSTASAAPGISFLSIPSPDSTQGWVSGIVEDVEPADHVVVLYIQVAGQWWGPKPTYEEPLTPIRSDRFWYTTFNTGGDDINATRFAAFLIPSSALGTVMPPVVSSDAALPASLSSFPSSETGRVMPVLRTVPSFARNGTDLVGLCFGPYLNGEVPHDTILSEEVIRERLTVIRNDTTWVRSYGTEGGLSNFSTIAHSLGMKSASGAWLTSDTEANLQQLNSLIAVGRSGVPDVLIVGSETLLRNNLTDRELVTYIQWVRREVPGVPVGTADGYGKFIEYPAVVEASDILLVNIFPFWENAVIDTAMDQTIEKFESIVTIAGGRPVVIAELGWPDAGSPHGDAVPGEQNAIRYLHTMTALLHTRDIPYFYFSAFDEAWKQNSPEGDVGPHWGLRYGNLNLKPGRLPLPKIPDTIGLYQNSAGTFFLKNSNSPGDADLIFQYGAGGNDWSPLVGDWDGDGDDTVGLYQTSIGGYFVKNSNGAGNADLVFPYGAGGDDWIHLSGDWDGDGDDTVGAYQKSIGVCFLTNTNEAGDADTVFQYGPGGNDLLPLVGQWV